MQSIFEAYKHPFVLTYLGASLLVIYLPISCLKDYIYAYYQSKHSKASSKPGRSSSSIGNHASSSITLLPLPGSPRRSANGAVVKPSSLPGSPMRVNGVHHTKSGEIDLEKMILMKEMNSQAGADVEAIHPFLLQKSGSAVEELKESVVFTMWEIAKISLVMAPLWLLTEVVIPTMLF